MPDENALDEHCAALTAKELRLSQQIAEAPITSLDDAIVKMRLARRKPPRWKPTRRWISTMGWWCAASAHVLEWLEQQAGGRRP
jgi:hypothetical protein